MFYTFHFLIISTTSADVIRINSKSSNVFNELIAVIAVLVLYCPRYEERWSLSPKRPGNEMSGLGRGIKQEQRVMCFLIAWGTDIPRIIEFSPIRLEADTSA